MEYARTKTKNVEECELDTEQGSNDADTKDDARTKLLKEECA
jgi:hypothetical protein